jgi:hypothetical protein
VEKSRNCLLEEVRPWLGAVVMNVDTDFVSVEISIGGAFGKEDSGGTVDVLQNFVETNEIILV